MKEFIKSPLGKRKKKTSKSFTKNLLDVFQVRDCETRHKPVWKGKKYIVLLYLQKRA